MTKPLSPEETKRVEEIVCEAIILYRYKGQTFPESVKQAILTALQPHLEENARLREALEKCHRTFITLEGWKGYSTEVPPNIVLQTVIAISLALKQT